MNIAFLFDNFTLSGSTTVSHDTAIMFKDRGIHTTFFTVKADLNIAVNELNCNIEYIPKGKLFTEEQIKHLAVMIKKNDIKIIFIPVLIKNIPNTLFSIIQKECNCKIVYWHHNVPLWEIIHKSYSKKILSRFFNRLMANKYKRNILRIYNDQLAKYDGYIVLCEQYKQEMVEKFDLSDAVSDKIYSIYNFIKIAKDVDLSVKQSKIVYVGRLAYRQKRIDRLIDIWERIYRQIPDWELEIYGEGPERKSLEKLIDKKKLERIALKGYCKHPNEIYKTASIVCLTSTYEGIPMCFLEGQNYGVVPIAFNVVGGMEYIASNNSGVLVEPFDLDEYGKQLIRLCQDREYRLAIANNCLKKREDYRNSVNEETWKKLFASCSLEF